MAREEAVAMVEKASHAENWKPLYAGQLFPLEMHFQFLPQVDSSLVILDT